MILGKSIYHVDQGKGLFYSKDTVSGFYNDLRQKVHKREDSDELPIITTDDGQKIYFPIEIAQYGLGAFDIYLETEDEKYYAIAKSCADWLINNKEKSGGWRTFAYIYPEHPYSSMAQSEAACLFMRIFTVCGDNAYLDHAKKSIDFMLIPIEDGGCTKYIGNDVYLCEHTDPSRTVALNGWIFSLWCLYDYIKLEHDALISDVYNRTISTLAKSLPLYDCKYWSLYDLSNRITSPFYHRLHLAQREVMYDLTNDVAFDEYHKKWSKYERSFICSKRAFLKKAAQKLTEKL